MKPNNPPRSLKFKTSICETGKSVILVKKKKEKKQANIELTILSLFVNVYHFEKKIMFFFSLIIIQLTKRFTQGQLKPEKILFQYKPTFRNHVFIATKIFKKKILIRRNYH